MGYYSDVAIMCGRRAFDMFKLAWERVDFKPSSIMLVRHTEDNPQFILRWEWVKWYQGYENVAAIEKVMKQLRNVDGDEYAYKCIIIGEDNSTYEEYNDAGFLFDSSFCVVVDIELPEYTRID